MVGAALLLAVLVTSPGPYTLVNGSGAELSDLAIRPADGSSAWQPLAARSLPARARVAMPSPGGELCAFDLRARLGGIVATWSSVNLCDVKSVTLNRRSDGTLWVDYD